MIKTVIFDIHKRRENASRHNRVNLVLLPACMIFVITETNDASDLYIRFFYQEKRKENCTTSFTFYISSLDLYVYMDSASSFRR